MNTLDQPGLDPDQVAPETGVLKVSSLKQLGSSALLLPLLGTTGSSALLFPHGTVWVISPTAPPLEQFGSSAYCSSLEQSGSSALLFFQCSGWLGPHSGCRGPPCRVDRARGVGSVESVKELDLERKTVSEVKRPKKSLIF